jgi:hypothetical protein
MVEATQSYRARMKAQRAELRAKREAQQAELHRRMALRVEVQRRAEIAVKQAIKDEGRRKVSQVPSREIKLAAAAYLAAHTELIAQVKPIVDAWAAERNSKHLSKSKAPAAQAVWLNETHEQNGAM